MERAEAKRTKWGMHDEDASVLKLGPNFQNAKCLMNAEVALILQMKLQNMAPGTQQKSDFTKAFEYVNRVKQFTDRDTVKRVRDDLEKKNYEDFEIVQLGNLLPGDAEEAKTLIPSLRMPDRQTGPVDSGALSEVLNQITTYRNL
mmetsp:Transcript_41011/g.92852  ORF Transcript_41011/g.92852 Transcript_41011/m.92852 type:complete len:145 (-) Transcript_41011:118-552(-)